jgi:hypothetical protein
MGIWRGCVWNGWKARYFEVNSVLGRNLPIVVVPNGMRRELFSIVTLELTLAAVAANALIASLKKTTGPRTSTSRIWRWMG